MTDPRTHMRWLRRARACRAAPWIAAFALIFGAGAWHELPAAGAGQPRPWPGGKLTWFDASGAPETVAAAAAGWNRSGVRVRLVRAASRESADVVFVADGEHLRTACGVGCLGLSSSIGRPSGGRTRVALDPQLRGAPTPLSVWVAMHEFGHVLGLRHREGSCSLMNAYAYADACTFAAGTTWTEQVPCGPASGDVAAAALLYGRDGRAQPCR